MFWRQAELVESSHDEVEVLVTKLEDSNLVMGFTSTLLDAKSQKSTERMNRDSCLDSPGDPNPHVSLLGVSTCRT